MVVDSLAGHLQMIPMQVWPRKTKNFYRIPQESQIRLLRSKLLRMQIALIPVIQCEIKVYYQRQSSELHSCYNQCTHAIISTQMFEYLHLDPMQISTLQNDSWYLVVWQPH